MLLVTSAEMRRIETEADARGHSYAAMMARAGQAVAEAVDERFAVARIVVLAGPGNNGGDGLVAARLLADEGHEVMVYLWHRVIAGDRLVADLVAHDIPTTSAEEDSDWSLLDEWLGNAEVVVDALLGTGLSRPLSGEITDLLDQVRAATQAPDGPFVVAVDVPTGLNSDDGTVDPHTVPADLTVTFAYPKVGLFRFPGAASVGDLIIADIGIPDGLATGNVHVAVAAEVAALLPARPLDSHKGTFGKALVVAGSLAYTGAAALAASGAYRAGCGLVTAAIPAVIHSVVAQLLPEATFMPLPDEDGMLCAAAVPAVRAALARYDAVLLGPGLGAGPPSAAFVGALMGDLAGLGAVPRLVVDADGLNLIAQLAGGPAALPALSVVTPHPGEMARLLGSDTETVNADRVSVARAAAQSWNLVVVLKGAFTVVAAPDGRVSINPFATPALATAGTGDVLSGLITGLLAQGVAPFEAAVLGAWLHGQAGQLAAEELGTRGVLARDVLDTVRTAFSVLEGVG
jgi:hydroxyethylthiazole kinase-like uncharacterized protein yjeF